MAPLPHEVFSMLAEYSGVKVKPRCTTLSAVSSSAPIPSILHLGFIPIKVNTQLCLKAAPLGPSPSAAAGSDEGLLPRQDEACTQRLASATISAIRQMPSSTPTSITITTKCGRATTPRRSRPNPPLPLPAPFTSSLHLPHIIFLFFFFGGGCYSLHLLSASLLLPRSPLPSPPSITVAPFHSLDPICCLSPA